MREISREWKDMLPAKERWRVEAPTKGIASLLANWEKSKQCQRKLLMGKEDGKKITNFSAPKMTL